MSEEKHDEQEIRKTWMAKARDVSMNLETLPAFLKELSDFEHGYGSICIAIAAGAVATGTALNNSPRGGITGFQASVVMWEFMRAWMSWPEAGIGHRLVDLDLLLYPQYEDRFNALSRETFDRVREKARKNLEDRESKMHPDVRAHMQSIADGQVPFGMRLIEK